ncbi:hypothetical protein RJ639_019153 [Escallonia herrerae]|uniref:THIF-type NAD/FAD binding fold domain-containing protein n=1 Tax=Escallonia herrerae TaxID=1293975 RepID=A0AA88VB52_9ASTE|nr:hypothetical protein RJ639_019153 [Escallonia herrerae]
MDSNGVESSRILFEFESLKSSKTKIDRRISELELQLCQIHQDAAAISNGLCALVPNGNSDIEHGLPPDMIYWYSRHLLLPLFGVQANMEYGWKDGPANLLKSSILVVGAGGLGSPALLYLAASGVGPLGLVDHDVVELNNLHRQEELSSYHYLFTINSTLQIVEHKEAVRTSKALEIMSKYNVVIDATDNVPSRYMISDCCVLLVKPPPTVSADHIYLLPISFLSSSITLPPTTDRTPYPPPLPRHDHTFSFQSQPDIAPPSSLLPRHRHPSHYQISCFNRHHNQPDVTTPPPASQANTIPLVSGAALGLEGQLTVYNYDGGPCYRCFAWYNRLSPSLIGHQGCKHSGGASIRTDASF